VFALLHLTPGDPVDAMMAESADASTKESLRRELGLDRPIAVQYAAWMGRLLRGDLRRSIRNGEPVLENVSRRIRPSLQLALLAMAIALTIAFPVAIASAVRHNTGVDRLGTDLRAVRHLHAELPARAAAHLRLRRHAALAADLRLPRPARRGLERAPLPDPPRRDAGARARPP